MGFHLTLTYALGLTVVAIPALLVLVLGLTSLCERCLSERTIGRLVQAASLAGLAAAIAMLALMLWTDTRNVPIDVGDWVHVVEEAEPGAGAHGPQTHEPAPVPEVGPAREPAASPPAAPPHFHFHLKFVFDRLSVPFVILSFLLCGTVGAFANSYLHREPGFNRFFVLYAVFLLGMVLTSLAGTIETLFAGWELVGVSSALLVAFFQERSAPVRNGLRVWSVYRVSDAALLLAAVLLHHLRGEGDFAALLGSGPWPEGRAALTQGQSLSVGALLLTAAAGKSALVPFSGWLPRAMEGPTPSSAVFYGALSVHLGAFLLLRVSPLLETSPLLCGATVALGLGTAVFAALAGRVQADIKTALSFASLTQVGIIVAEIGLGLRYLALIHILGHACFRTLQFLRASSILQDYHSLENALGHRLPQSTADGWSWLPEDWRRRAYRLALDRGHLDALLNEYCVRPVLAVFEFCDGLERRWTDFLSARPSRESDELSPLAGSVEDLS